MKTCPHCNTKNVNSAGDCEYCGYSLQYAQSGRSDNEKINPSCLVAIIVMIISAIIGAFLYSFVFKGTNESIYGGFVGVFVGFCIYSVINSIKEKSNIFTITFLMIVAAIIPTLIFYLGGDPLIETILLAAPAGAFVPLLIYGIGLMFMDDEDSEKQDPQSGRIAELANKLINDSGDTLNKTLDEIEAYSVKGNSFGVKALEKAIAKLEGKSYVACFKPGNYNLSQNVLESDQAGQLIELASKGLLLEDPLKSGALITAFYRTEGDADQLHANIFEAGGPAQEKAFILLDNQLKSYAQVIKAKAEGKRLSCPKCDYKGTVSDFKKAVVMGDVPSDMYGARVLACPQCGVYAKKVGSL